MPIIRHQPAPAPSKSKPAPKPEGKKQVQWLAPPPRKSAKAAAEKGRSKPDVIQWKDAKMLRANSFNFAAQRVANHAWAQQIVTIGIIGMMGSGKTELARTLAHTLHTMMQDQHKIPYVVKEFGEEEMIDFENQIKMLRGNSILIFDDISYLKQQMSGKEFASIQAALTKIRHLAHEDVRIIMMYNYHYTKALDKFIRGTDFDWFTSITQPEKDNVQQIVGTRNVGKLAKFMRHRARAIREGHWRAATSNGMAWVEYKYHDPFGPALFWDGERLQEVVVPLRTWISPECTICGAASKQGIMASADVDVEWGALEAQYGREHTIVATKLWLHDNQVDVYSPPILSTLKAVRRIAKSQTIPIREIMRRYNLVDRIKYHKPRGPDD